MRAWWAGGCLAWGCLAKPGAPAAGPGPDASSDASSDAIVCQAPSVRDAFDVAGSGCGSNFTMMGTGTATRDGATLELGFDLAQYVICQSGPFDMRPGVFVEAPSVNLAPTDGAYMSATSSSGVRLGMSLVNGQLSVFDDNGVSQTIIVAGPATRWWRIVVNGSTLIGQASLDGKSWMVVGSLADGLIDSTKPFVVVLGTAATTAVQMHRSVQFDNFDICPP